MHVPEEVLGKAFGRKFGEGGLPVHLLAGVKVQVRFLIEAGIAQVAFCLLHAQIVVRGIVGAVISLKLVRGISHGEIEQVGCVRHAHLTGHQHEEGGEISIGLSLVPVRHVVMHEKARTNGSELYLSAGGEPPSDQFANPLMEKIAARFLPRKHSGILGYGESSSARSHQKTDPWERGDHRKDRYR